jgi:hypothetical protein
VELFPLFAVRTIRALVARGDAEEDRLEEGVTHVKIAKSEAVLPVIAVHKAG